MDLNKKFRCVFQHHETGRILFLFFNFLDIKNGKLADKEEKLINYYLISVDEFLGKDKNNEDIFINDIIKYQFAISESTKEKLFDTDIIKYECNILYPYNRILSRYEKIGNKYEEIKFIEKRMDNSKLLGDK